MATAALAPNRKIGGYVLLEHLGAGGIGEVWKAHDPKLNRVVALKFLSVTRPGSAPGRDLLAEARAASALNHPNIVTIFEVSEREGGTYLAMEFVEGETLRARLRKGPLPLAEASQIAVQVASALAVAHQHGIIHRDLKPENIMLRLDGYVKLVDFGLAKKLPWAKEGESTLTDSATRTGQVVGTFQYMSPEQARGQLITPASDVFSLGIVIYEMLTGEHPFESGNVVDTLSAILTKEPMRVSVRCPAAPITLTSTVERALLKAPEARFPSAVEMTASLRGKVAESAAESAPKKWKVWMFAAAGLALLAVVIALAMTFFRGGGGVGGMQVQSVAVLNLRAGDDPTATAVSESLAEDLGVALSRAGLQVASHSTARGVTGDARSIGGQLGVDAVLDGSIRSSGNNYKVHLELVSTRTGFQLWSGNFLLDSQELLTGNEPAAARMATELSTAMAARGSK
jgi:TolB-like protein